MLLWPGPSRMSVALPAVQHSRNKGSYIFPFALNEQRLFPPGCEQCLFSSWAIVLSSGSTVLARSSAKPEGREVRVRHV